MMVNGLMAKKKVAGNIFLLIKIFMMGNFVMAKELVKENTVGKIAVIMMDNGKETK